MGFVNLLRASHGKIFATIAEVRAGTQNDVIRRHATQANQTVLDHMTVLEDTGLVDAKTLADVAAAVNPPKQTDFVDRPKPAGSSDLLRGRDDVGAELLEHRRVVDVRHHAVRDVDAEPVQPLQLGQQRGGPSRHCRRSRSAGAGPKAPAGHSATALRRSACS